SFYKA
ncbi:major Facilitator Superfamily protein, partial [Vibrio parahaemolyticus V-223/04]